MHNVIGVILPRSAATIFELSNYCNMLKSETGCKWFATVSNYRIVFQRESVEIGLNKENDKDARNSRE